MLHGHRVTVRAVPPQQAHYATESGAGQTEEAERRLNLASWSIILNSFAYR